MNLLVIPYPEIDPVLVQLGPLAIRIGMLVYERRFRAMVQGVNDDGGENLL